MKCRYIRELLTRIAAHAENDSNDYTLPGAWAFAAAWVCGNVEMKREMLDWPKLPRPLARPTDLFEAGFVTVQDSPAATTAPATGPAAAQTCLFLPDSL